MYRGPSHTGRRCSGNRAGWRHKRITHRFDPVRLAKGCWAVKDHVRVYREPEIRIPRHDGRAVLVDVEHTGVKGGHVLQEAVGGSGGHLGLRVGVDDRRSVPSGQAAPCLYDIF